MAHKNRNRDLGLWLRNKRLQWELMKRFKLAWQYQQKRNEHDAAVLDALELSKPISHKKDQDPEEKA